MSDTDSDSLIVLSVSTYVDREIEEVLNRSNGPIIHIDVDYSPQPQPQRPEHRQRPRRSDRSRPQRPQLPVQHDTDTDSTIDSSDTAESSSSDYAIDLVHSDDGDVRTDAVTGDNNQASMDTSQENSAAENDSVAMQVDNDNGSSSDSSVYVSPNPRNLRMDVLGEYSTGSNVHGNEGPINIYDGASRITHPPRPPLHPVNDISSDSEADSSNNVNPRPRNMRAATMGEYSTVSNVRDNAVSFAIYDGANRITHPPRPPLHSAIIDDISSGSDDDVILVSNPNASGTGTNIFFDSDSDIYYNDPDPRNHPSTSRAAGSTAPIEVLLSSSDDDEGNAPRQLMRNRNFPFVSRGRQMVPWNMHLPEFHFVRRRLPTPVQIEEATLKYDYGAPGSEFNPESCAICITNFEVGAKVRRLPCFHLFHVTCIDDWFKYNHICPICRNSIMSKD